MQNKSGKALNYGLNYMGIASTKLWVELAHNMGIANIKLLDEGIAMGWTSTLHWDNEH